MTNKYSIDVYNTMQLCATRQRCATVAAYEIESRA